MTDEQRQVLADIAGFVGIARNLAEQARQMVYVQTVTHVTTEKARRSIVAAHDNLVIASAELARLLQAQEVER